MCHGVTIHSYIFTRTRIRYRKQVLHRYIVTHLPPQKNTNTNLINLIIEYLNFLITSKIQQL